MRQAVDRKPLGRPKIASEENLLFWEQAWFSQFVGLRDGCPGCVLDVPGGEGSAILLVAKQDTGLRRNSAVPNSIHCILPVTNASRVTIEESDILHV